MRCFATGSSVITRGLPRVPGVGAMLNGFTDFGLHWPVASQGMAIALILGLAAGLGPAVGAYRSRIAEMLRQV